MHNQPKKKDIPQINYSKCSSGWYMQSSNIKIHSVHTSISVWHLLLLEWNKLELYLMLM